METRPTVPLLLLALGVAALMGSSSGCKKTTRNTPVARGEGIFIRTCASCHGADGRAGARVGTAKAKNLADPKLFERLGEQGVKDVIRGGRGAMPSYGGVLDEQDLNDLVAYLRTLPGR